MTNEDSDNAILSRGTQATVMLAASNKKALHEALKVLYCQITAFNYFSEFSKYFGGKVLRSGQDSIQVLITFDESGDTEPRNRKFEVDEESENVSKIGKELTFRWTDLIEPRNLGI